VKRDDGVSTVELAFIVPFLLLLMTTVIPIVKAGWEYMAVSRATAHGIRYATRVETNARYSPAGDLTRRPTRGEVQDFVKEAAGPLTLSSVSVSRDPSKSLPGVLITVKSSYVITFGPLAEIANSVKTTFFGGNPLLPESKEITVSARGREE
jgi:hypothetical protein